MKATKIAFATAFAMLAVSVADAQWSTFHGDNQRTGATSATGPTDPQLKWTVDLGGAIRSSPVVGSDGTIYTGAVWQETLVPRAFVHAINPDGSHRWRFEVDFIDDQTLATPAVAADGTVYVGTASGTFYAIDSTGHERWRYQASEPILSHALIAPDGTVYVHLDAHLTAFTSAGTRLWQVDLGRNLAGGPTLDPDGTIYSVAENDLLAVHPDGTVKWRSLFNGANAPAVVSPNGDIIVCSGWIYCLHRDDGSLKWYTEYGVPNFGAPAVDASGNLYYASDWEMWKYSPDGQLQWEVLFEKDGKLGKTYGSVVIDGAGNLFLGMGTSKRGAYGFEKRLDVYSNDGVRIGGYRLPQIPGTSSPAFGPDGTLYIGCHDGKLYAFE